MYYTVKEMAELANVTVKTLHHYHKIKLLVPCKLSEAGYRLYGQNELERLQEILFFRELDFSLKHIQEILTEDADRVNILTKQRGMLKGRSQRLERLIRTLDDSILHATRHESMDKEALFRGFNEKEWRELLAEQSGYVKEKYGYAIEDDKPIDAGRLNEQAQEASHFLNTLAKALREGWSCQDKSVQNLITDHVSFLNTHGFSFDAQSLLAQARFLVRDDFHRKTMETTQIGLAYFYLAAVEVYAQSGL